MGLACEARYFAKFQFHPMITGSPNGWVSVPTPAGCLPPCIDQVKQYLGKTDAALSTYYRSLVFTGKAFMPKMLGSDAEVAAYVAKTKGAIGYVRSDASAPGAKAIAVK